MNAINIEMNLSRLTQLQNTSPADGSHANLLLFSSKSTFYRTKWVKIIALHQNMSCRLSRFFVDHLNNFRTFFSLSSLRLVSSEARGRQ